ncbi:hypothetical protein GTA62_13085 [Roseobacter sp. HKCCD9010]|uniref:phage tail-collar fiber domain-containing protein n=1 Tax=unclassified Roseobacter TaxID=196798 RepID=UPI001492F29A|nr:MULTISPECIES: phage tail protein [unclassified Roseobacter]MBF9049882.1 hypothetical protein [Rhodobacterales bacterium HKCCD4356]NNV13579.1 hypothetical protein [Roseobacter sp. HKCCD7357]NNV16413.1 hypothetical protein [Roseobacter sp. HKCCD8768]NNV25872.1 hypothetical protein [Roseobacter sp. HKCCD8192]NNV30130.1 hypothetical protein [Roseobacter sp. HKCCD9061]
MASFAMLTNVGRNKEAAALANATALEISEIAWGDGTRIPAGGETALENEQGRKAVQGQGTVADALNTAFFDVLLTEDEGPFVIREAGIFDVDGDMIAIAHYDPPVNKPLNTVSAHLRIKVVFTDLQNLIIQIDASTAFVTPEQLAQAIGALKAPTVTLLTEGANATYVTPEGCKALHVKGVGGGAGGEFPRSHTGIPIRFGMPGAGGAGFEAWLTPEPLQEFTYTVGAGGSPGSYSDGQGSSGGSGGTTRFGSITANGGTNVHPSTTATAWHGNDPLTKVLTFRGSPGRRDSYSSDDNREFFQDAGGSIFGPSDSIVAWGSGQDATVPGTGGVGGVTGAPMFPRSGADGIIVVTEYY